MQSTQTGAWSFPMWSSVMCSTAQDHTHAHKHRLVHKHRLSLKQLRNDADNFSWKTEEMLYLFSQDVCFCVFKMFCSFKVQRSVVALHSRPSCQFCFHDHIQYFDHLLTPAFKSRTALFKNLYSGYLYRFRRWLTKSCESQDLFHHQSRSPPKNDFHMFFPLLSMFMIHIQSVPHVSKKLNWLICTNRPFFPLLLWNFLTSEQETKFKRAVITNSCYGAIDSCHLFWSL